MLHDIFWQHNARVADECLCHPFVRGLADGTLEPETFRRYVAQDAFFLNAFARAYAFAVARSQDMATFTHLCELLNGVLRELQLHAGYAKELKIGNPYQSWIATYSSPDFQTLIARVESLLDSMAQDSQAVRDAYAYAMQCELNFFSAMLDPAA